MMPYLPTLPASLDDIEVRITGQHETRNGVAYAATVHRRTGDVHIGTIENHGNGGGTQFYANSPAVRSWWEEAVVEFGPAALEHTNAAFVDAGLDPLPMLSPYAVAETLADALFDRAEAAASAR